jgi:hypothetical protein
MFFAIVHGLNTKEKITNHCYSFVLFPCIKLLFMQSILFYFISNLYRIKLRIKFIEIEISIAFGICLQFFLK